MKPWRRHAFYLANKSFWKWASRTYDIPNPMIDRWGNAAIEAPKTPKTVLYTMTPEKVHRLLEAASCIRDRAAISLLADSGARRSEIVAIKTNDMDLEKNCIKVIGKGNKEGYLIFGEVTKAQILRHLEENSPTDTLFDLDTEGLKTMLRRLLRLLWGSVNWQLRALGIMLLWRFLSGDTFCMPISMLSMPL